MVVPSASRTISTSLPMEPPGSSVHEHVVDVSSSSRASSSTASQNGSSTPHQLHIDGQPSTSTSVPVYQSASASRAASNARSSSLNRRENAHNRNTSPLNSGIWISVELVLTVAQIVAAIVVLAMSRHEDPHTPLVLWVVGYAAGCVASLPLLYWRYHHRHQASRRGSSQSSPTAAQNDSIVPASNVDSRQPSGSISQGAPYVSELSSRLKVLAEYFKMALDCFFAVWFVVGNVWVFGGHSSSTDAPNLYRICVVFLTFSCIGYAMPFIFCATVCCCLPCIIRVMGFREDNGQSRGATAESINSLPTYKFKLNKNKHDKGSNSGVVEGGVVAAGTNKERAVSGEDAVCCICLAKYANNDELRELLCSHFFHKDCVDKWLKINAACPLCKAEVGDTIV